MHIRFEKVKWLITSWPLFINSCHHICLPTELISEGKVVIYLLLRWSSKESKCSHIPEEDDSTTFLQYMVISSFMAVQHPNNFICFRISNELVYMDCTLLAMIL
ncbi:hypothetical protein DAI22_08g134400 [Oryza sativa Japonica Group]|nr:hypothetical protein DAI22_08g134400 [Oryza sativa Japonica Group]